MTGFFLADYSSSGGSILRVAARYHRLFYGDPDFFYGRLCPVRSGYPLADQCFFDAAPCADPLRHKYRYQYLSWIKPTLVGFATVTKASLKEYGLKI